MALDPDMLAMRQRALELIHEGACPTHVARVLGCARSSIYNWLKADRDSSRAQTVSPPETPAGSDSNGD